MPGLVTFCTVPKEDAPPLAKVSEPWHNVRSVVETLIDPPSDLDVSLVRTSTQGRRPASDVQLLRTDSALRTFSNPEATRPSPKYEIAMSQEPMERNTHQVDEDYAVLRNAMLHNYLNGFHSRSTRGWNCA